MSNFDYLKELKLTRLHGFCAAAEQFQSSYPEVSVTYARRALEYLVKALYVMRRIPVVERTSLYELVEGDEFKEFINDSRVMTAIHYVRQIGNRGAHGEKVSERESYLCLTNIYNVVTAVLVKLKAVQEVKPFNKEWIPAAPANPVAVPAPAETVQVSPEDPIVTGVTPDVLSDPTPVKVVRGPSDLTEAETRKLYIDLMLREAGWDVLSAEGVIQPLKACVEVKVQGMPNKEGVGYADYVLFAADGKPLAVIEAKKAASESLEKGRQQATLYAECLMKKYGVRPVIYYTNGFVTHIIDGLGYPPRRLYGFHSARDLEWMIQQRGREPIQNLGIRDSITDRPYQKRAVKAICEHYNTMHRRGLLVMATGTGKTRVAISLVDVLTRNGWVKDVLFLADRISLVKQAQHNFKRLLPGMPTCVLSDERAPNTTARIVFSTYQTMINYIDAEEKPFSVGRFDLIIIDEAHRSIFGKYGAIFSYFDALMTGLTATPRNEIDRSTYDIFEVEQGEPNFAYELDEAVRDGFLVNYQGFKRGTVILEEGIQYDNLTPEEKEQMEKIWEYEQTRRALDLKAEYQPRDIMPAEIFHYIFNQDTVDQVLQDLMENGLKVQNGDRIGKTIIFAYNHRHAEMIVNRFNALYPEYGAGFCRLIDNYVNYAQSLIEDFEQRDNEPQIAVSVDMLDTGIDVPDVLNLVFFKIVRSKIKFLQMIGRGTRLSKDIFGTGQDKKEFYIFDWCRNFEYFGTHPEGKIPPPIQSLTEKIFCLRTEIAFHLQNAKYQEDEYAKKLHDEIKGILKAQVANLSDTHISVRAKWETVTRFRNEDSWTCISEKDVFDLKNDIAPLIPKDTQDVNAKRFDLLLLTVELSCLDEEVKDRPAVVRVMFIASKLQEKASIPMIQNKMPVIEEVLTPNCWENKTLNWLEKVRTEIRDLVRYLEGESDQWFTVNIQDEVRDNGVVEGVPFRVTYKESVIDYLKTNRDLPVLQKIYKMEQLTEEDIVELQHILWNELGTQQDYDQCTQGMLCGSNVAIFIRSIIGVDKNTALEKFSQFIDRAQELNSEQLEFLDNIITYVCENGDITNDIVVNEAPFDERLGVFDDLGPISQYINNIHNIAVAN